MYYGESGEEMKKFNTRDGMGFALLREKGILTGIVTSEDTALVSRRAAKLKLDFLVQGKAFGSKLEAVRALCREKEIALEEVAYIGDDINCVDLLQAVGFAACPADAMPGVKALPGIYVSPLSGGQGCVRDFIVRILGD